MPGGQRDGRQGGVLPIKLGGSVITDKERPFSLRLAVVERVAWELARAAQEQGLSYVIVLGGGSYGHAAAKMVREAGAPAPEALSIVTGAMAELALAAADVFSMAGLRPVLYPPHAFCRPRGLRPGCDWGLVVEALEAGVTPVTYGDAYPCGEGWCIVSGDELLVEAACAVGASRAVYVSDVDGIYGPDGRVLGEASLQELRGLAAAAGRRGGYDVTGGLARKIAALAENRCPGLASVWVVNGMREGRLYRLLSRWDAEATLVTL